MLTRVTENTSLCTLVHTAQIGCEALSPTVERPWREAVHSVPSNAGIKNAWSCAAPPQYVFTEFCFIKHRNRCDLLS
jgi:hypothetical protein